MSLNNEQQKAVSELRGTNALISELIAAKAELEAAQRERDEALKQLENIAQNLCGVKVQGEITHDLVYALVEGEIEKQFELRTETELQNDMLKRERDDLRAKLLAEQAGNAEMRENYQDLRNFVRAVCLLLQRHRGATTGEMDQMFQISYRLYTKHDVEHPLPTPLGTTFLAERARHVKALEEIAGYGKDGICPYGCDCPNIARTALNRNEP